MRNLKWNLVLFALTGLVLFTASPASSAPLPGGTLDPLTIPKYVSPLVIPPEMPSLGTTADGVKYYEIAVRQFQQQILPVGPTTTVWSYGSVQHPDTFHYPAFTIEAAADQPARVKWINQLVNDPEACAASATPATDPACNYLKHLLPVDRSLHWANPELLTCMNGLPRTDCRPDPMNGNILQQPYEGPVPVVVHLHGSHVDAGSDGYPEAWWLPAANNIPANYATRGKHFGQAPGALLEDGAALYEYRNDQRATTLWFHDHSLGMTRTNVYAGPAGFYLLRDGVADLPSEPTVIGGLPGPAPKAGDLPGTNYYEIPIVIQDRSFNADGSLYYPGTRAFFDGFSGPYVGDWTYMSDVAPLWNPEFFGNTIVVNGKTWPFLNVEPRKYRFRFLNGSQSRFLILENDKKLAFTQIGSEGGFLPAPVVLKQLLMGPAERADVIVDFSRFTPGDRITLLNVGPDSPFGGLPVAGKLQADPATTGQVMQFNVIPLTAADTSTTPAVLPPVPLYKKPDNVRKVSLNEEMSMMVCVDANLNYIAGVTPPLCGGIGMPFGPTAAKLGTVAGGLGVPLMWEEPITENPALDAVEVWEISNFTVDAHPIHVHMVMFQVVNRQNIATGKTRGPEPWEMGLKDTVIAYPGEITRIKAKFDIPGLFVWHCHILEHEDNEMMRPYYVGPVPPML